METSSIFSNGLTTNMKISSSKSHLLMPGHEAIANIDNNPIHEDIHELLGMTIDSELTFETHAIKLCKKASQKLNAFARISNYMTFDKIKVIIQ